MRSPMKRCALSSLMNAGGTEVSGILSQDLSPTKTLLSDYEHYTNRGVDDGK
jgi:hypothetical protein